jgi:hypothetical protein
LTDFERTERGRPRPNANKDTHPFSYEDDSHTSLAECLDVDRVDNSWMERTFLQWATTEEKKSDLIITHGHCRQPNSKLIRALNTRPSIPVVSTIRDPLLSVLTLARREHRDYALLQDSRPYIRLGRTTAHVDRYISILGIPRDNILLFPIDVGAREDKVGKLFSYCGLEKTSETDSYIQRWAPANTTKDWVGPGGKKEEGSDLFEDLKVAISCNDVQFVNRYLKIEFECLQKQEELKQKLSQLGYSSLIWF